MATEATDEDRDEDLIPPEDKDIVPTPIDEKHLEYTRALAVTLENAGVPKANGR